MTALPVLPEGAYLGTLNDQHRPQLWWARPGRPREPLPLIIDDHPAAPDFEHDSTVSVAKTILFHATGDHSVVDLLHPEFVTDIVAPRRERPTFELPTAELAHWLVDHGVDLTDGRGPSGRAPTIEQLPTNGTLDRYVVRLDRWDLMLIDLEPTAARAARVAVANRIADRDDDAFDRAVAFAPADEDHRPGPAGERVAVEELPFGGWAVMVDGYDLAIIERDATGADRARVAVYDHSDGEQFLAFDETLRYRPLPTTAAALTAADRLRRFSETSTATTPDRTRTLER